MSYCPKCGNKVDETMVFCPRCGASLKGAPPPSQAPPAPQYRPRDEKSEKNEKQEKREKEEEPEKREKNEKGEQGFLGFLIGGLILITLGLFSLLRFTGFYTSGESWAVMLLIIGVIIIIGAIYVALIARRRSPQPR
ncbi:MAG: zinc ribbon domain-containing protein [Candidatus Bathyarchaeota archaeon]|nr:zinc ribbon domain-containing protein [Candidatus Bathyarchaeota archaeon]